MCFLYCKRILLKFCTKITFCNLASHPLTASVDSERPVRSRTTRTIQNDQNDPYENYAYLTASYLLRWELSSRSHKSASRRYSCAGAVARPCFGPHRIKMSREGIDELMAGDSSTSCLLKLSICQKACLTVSWKTCQ